MHAALATALDLADLYVAAIATATAVTHEDIPGAHHLNRSGRYTEKGEVQHARAQISSHQFHTSLVFLYKAKARGSLSIDAMEGPPERDLRVLK